MRGPRSQLLLIFGLMTGLLFAGTFGFRVIEGWRFLDAFYMTLITLTTVGYAEVIPLSDNGRVFNAFLIMAGVTTIFASIGILTEMVIKLELAEWGMHLTPEAPRSSIRALEDHSRTLGEFQERFAFRFQIQPLPSPRGAQ